jgi:hypothetical protein
LISQAQPSADATALAELEREIVVMKRLAHPNLVRFLGSERTADELYIAMEYVRGGALTDLIKRIASQQSRQRQQKAAAEAEAPSPGAPGAASQIVLPLRTIASYTAQICDGAVRSQVGALVEWHSASQRSAAQLSTAQHSTAQHSTAQHSTAQHSTAQHSTAQHSTAQPAGSRSCRVAGTHASCHAGCHAGRHAARFALALVWGRRRVAGARKRRACVRAPFAAAHLPCCLSNRLPACLAVRTHGPSVRAAMPPRALGRTRD